MPYKDFVDGEQLTTGDIEQYLQGQAIVGCTSTTRPSPVRVGMRIWETDTQSEKYWDGSSWVFLRGLNKFVRKPIDESLTNSTTMQNDDHMVVTVAVYSAYVIDVFIILSSNNTEDFRLAFDTPSGTDTNWVHYAPPTSQTDADHTTIGFYNYIPGQTASIAGFGNGGRVAFKVRGAITTTSISGSFICRWAQNSASANATIVRQDSYMFLRKVG